MTQDLSQVLYYGRTAPGLESFQNHKNYIGELTRNVLFSKLTYHDNLILLSDGEAHALVLNEAMSAGLGLVISELAWSNVDPKLPFISIIPELLINDKDYVKYVIEENAKKSIQYRNDIRKYASTWNWENIVKNVYLPAIKIL